MNHLAHALLADAGGIEFALGSAQGDFIHGHPDPAWPAARRAGLRFHRAIDHYTDAHPEVVATRNLFEPPLRRYAGIMLDVWFDHLLVRGWNRYDTDETLAQFADRWLALLDAHAAELPPSLQAFLAWMHGHGLPAGYGDAVTLDVVFHALALRLSRPSPIGDALPALRERADTLQRHFDAFFPELVGQARQLRLQMLA
ncbi:MAG TPA: ACP phosphodiesterase [Rhodanobacteraceae bacterium]|nr:ACP phosphodiesterase [Rhodanobacteraceae bacterium]